MKSMQITFSVAAFFLLITTTALAADVCNTHMQDMTPSIRYHDNQDGTVTDIWTGLMWKRCPEVYVFSDNGTPAVIEDFNCTYIYQGGVNQYEDLLTWQEALQIAGSSRYAGYSDWRLPNIKELMSIANFRCDSGVNSEVFGLARFEGSYWTSTPSAGTTTFAWIFSYSGVPTSVMSKNSTHVVRLVRGVQTQ